MPALDVRAIPLESRQEAAEQCADWGYPRPIAWAEMVDGYWLRSRHGIAWFVRGVVPGEWFLHGIAAPSKRRVNFPPPGTFESLRVVAGLLGARRVTVPMMGASPGLCRWLLRTGHFQASDMGPYFELE